MQVLSVMEQDSVFGGDAAITRLPGTNSWGEKIPWGGGVQQVTGDDDMATYLAECIGGAGGHDGASAFACLVVIVRSGMDMLENSRRGR